MLRVPLRQGRQRGSSEAGRGQRHLLGSPHTWVKRPQDRIRRCPVRGARCAPPESRERAWCARPSGGRGLRRQPPRKASPGSPARSPAPPPCSALPVRPPGQALTRLRRRRSRLLPPDSPGASASARTAGHVGAPRHVTPERGARPPSAQGSRSGLAVGRAAGAARGRRGGSYEDRKAKASRDGSRAWPSSRSALPMPLVFRTRVSARSEEGLDT